MSVLERVLLQVSTWLTAVTGIAFLVMKYGMTSDDPFSVINHPWQPHMLALHLLVAPLLIFSLGLIMRDHILGWLRDDRMRRGRASGILTTLLAAPMIVSGYLMQILTDPGPRRWLAWVHIVTGLLFTAVFLAHLVTSRIIRRALQNGAAAVRTLPRSSGLLLLRLDWAVKRGLRSRARSCRGG